MHLGWMKVYLGWNDLWKLCLTAVQCCACISGFYGQLQTFCPPHYPDSQRTMPPSSSCSVVPSFEDYLVPTSMGQAGFDVFHRAFSTHSGITGMLESDFRTWGNWQERPIELPVTGWARLDAAYGCIKSYWNVSPLHRPLQPHFHHPSLGTIVSPQDNTDRLLVNFPASTPVFTILPSCFQKWRIK